MAEVKVDWYNVVDKDGNVVDSLEFPEGGSLYEYAKKNREAGESIPVYKNENRSNNGNVSGEIYEPLFTPKEAQDISSITLDKKTGNISVKAPQIVFRNSAVKENFDSALKAISRAYKVDSTQKFSLLADNDEKKTAEEWLKDIENSFKNEVPRIMERERVRTEHKTNAGVELSDEDLIKMGTAAVEYNDENGDVVKVTKNTLQAIPASLMRLPAFSKLGDAWDKDKHVVKWGDLAEVWNRDNTSDEDILEVYSAVERYFANKDFSDPTEYAEMTAMATFLRQQDPSVNFWRGTGEVLGNFIEGIIEGAATFDAGVLSAAEGATNWIINMGETIYAAEGGADWGEAWKASKADDKTFVRDYLVPQLDEWKDQKHTDLMNLNEAAAASYRITETVTPIAMQIAVSVAAGNAMADYAATSIGRVVTSIAAKYGESAASMASLTAANIASGAITAEEIAKGLYAGTEIMLTLSNATTAAATALKAINTVRSISYAAGAIAKTADIAAQAIVDVTLSNPKLFRQLLETDDDEAKAYAMEQLVSNAAGEIIGVGAGRLITNIGKSDFGRVLNAKFAPRINGIKAKIGQAADNIKINVFHGGDKNWLIAKRDKLVQKALDAEGKWYNDFAVNRASKAQRQLKNYAGRLVERQAALKTSELAGKVTGANWDETVKAAKDVQKEMRRIISEANVNVIGAIYNQDLSSEVAHLVANDASLKSARDGYVNKLTTVLKAEDADGLGKGLQKVTVDGKSIRVLSKETNEYVNALYRERVAKATIDLSDIAENVKGAQEELPHLEEIIKNFQTNHSQELVNAANELEKQGRSFSEAVQNTRVRLGFMPQDTLDGLRASGFFDDGYMRQQRAKSWTAYKKGGGKLKISEIRDEVQKLGWGDTSEWQDITLVMFDDLEDTARQVVRKRAVDSLKDLGFKVDTVVDADGTRVVTEINPIRQKVASTIEEHANNFVDRMDDSFFDEFFGYRMKKQVVMDKNAETILSGGKVASAKASTAKVTRADRHRFYQMLTDNDIDSIVVSDPRSVFNIAVQDDKSLWQFRKGLDRKSKEILDDKMKSELGRLYDLPASSATKRSKLVGGDIASAGVRQAQLIDDASQMTQSELKSLYSFENFQRVLADDPEVISAIKRSYAEAKFIDNYDDVVADIKKEARILDTERIYKDNVAKLRDLRAKYDLPDVEQRVLEAADDLIETAIDDNYANKTVMQAMNALGDASAGGDDIVEYVTTKSLYEKRGAIAKSFKKQAESNFNSQITTQIQRKYANNPKAKREALKKVTGIAESYAEEASRMFEDRLIQKYDEITGRLAAQGSDILDKNDYFARVRALNKQIKEAASNPNVIKTYGAYGYEEFVELSPTIADMFTNKPMPLRRGPFGAIQSAFVRTYRAGTTGGLIPGSLINQAFRDTGNAIIAGDAWKSNEAVKRILSEEFGDDIAEYMQREMPDVWETLLNKADETGRPVAELAAERELELGAMNVESQLEKNIYQLGRERRLTRNADGIYERNVLDNIEDALDKAQGLVEKPNAWRESYLRNRVYANNLADGLESGMSLPEARTFAQFMQQEATTNFSRQSYHLANLTQTVPYLGAAINGSKSFWRLYALDPVGITTRLVGGYVVPVISLTAMSLNDEESRQIYERIPEYEKRDHLVFVIDKQIISIPIPQEMSNFVTPVQHMVEKMNKAGDNSFATLMANDLLGSFPIDMSGFINIDADKILEGNLVTDHLIPGFSKISSSLMPPLVKSGFMMFTGIDPYTNKRINTADQGVDLETGERIVYDYQTGAAARAIGEKIGDLMTAQMAQKVLTNLFGKGGMAIIDGIGDIAQSVSDEKTSIAEGFSSAAQRYAESGIDRLRVKLYGDESNLAWNRAVRQLEIEKDALLNDKDYQKDLEALSRKELTGEARQKVESRVRTKQQQYMQRVLDASNNLINKYGGTFDRYKMTTVISLMNLERDAVNVNPYNEYSTYLSEEDTNLNRAIAVETMMRMGFSSTNDSSLFGYYKQNDDGTYTVKYNSPLAVLNYNRTSWQQGNIDEAEIRSALDEAGISRNQMYSDEFYEAKAAGKDALKKYKSEWNKKVVKVLAPYIRERGVEAFFNAASNRDLIGGGNGIIFVDNPYNTKKYLIKIFGDK